MLYSLPQIFTHELSVPHWARDASSWIHSILWTTSTLHSMAKSLRTWTACHPAMLSLRIFTYTLHDYTKMPN